MIDLAKVTAAVLECLEDDGFDRLHTAWDALNEDEKECTSLIVRLKKHTPKELNLLSRFSLSLIRIRA